MTSINRNLISLENYHHLRDSEQLSTNMELIKGRIIKKMTIRPIHSYFTGILADVFSSLISDELHLRKGEPLTLRDSEPEPDIAIVLGSKKDYIKEHPKTATFVVEVALSSIYLDREKSGIYAESNINEYWIVNLNSFEIEVYREPTPNGYKSKKIYQKEELIPISLKLNHYFCLKDYL